MQIVNIKLEFENISLYIPSISNSGIGIIEVLAVVNKLMGLFNAYFALMDLIDALKFIHSHPAIKKSSKSQIILQFNIS